MNSVDVFSHSRSFSKLVVVMGVFALLLSTSNRLYPQSAIDRNSAEGGTVAPEGTVRCIRMVSPNYPPGTTIDQQKESTVVLRVRIQRSGVPVPLNIKAGPENLEIQAENAVRQWRFAPYAPNGDPVEITTLVKVNFKPGKPGGIVSYPTR